MSERDVYLKVEVALRGLYWELGRQLRQADYANEVVKLRYMKDGVHLAVREVWKLLDDAMSPTPANTHAVESPGHKRNAPPVLGSSGRASLGQEPKQEAPHA